MKADIADDASVKLKRKPDLADLTALTFDDLSTRIMGNKVPYQKLDMAANDDVIPPVDPEKGAEIFREHCAGCHDIDKSGEHRAGPNLMGIWGREANTIEGFAFVESDEKKGVIWGDKTIYDFLEKPHIPGTKFIFRELRGKAEEKANLVAFLKKTTDPKNS